MNDAAKESLKESLNEVLRRINKDKTAEFKLAFWALS